MSDVDRLLQVMDRQQERYVRMVAVMEEQKAVAATGDIDALLALIDRKQTLLSEIDALEVQAAEARGDWDAMRARLDTTERRRLSEAVARKRRVLEQLVRLENEGLERMRPSRPEGAPGVMNRSRARTAYGA